MPLIILGILVLLCILAYAIVKYLGSEEVDTRPVRERYPQAFSPRGSNNGNNVAADEDDETIYAKGFVDTDDLRGDIEHIVNNLKDNAKSVASRMGIDLDDFRRSDDKKGKSPDDEDDDKTIIFPSDNVEEEKHKRNIH